MVYYVKFRISNKKGTVLKPCPLYTNKTFQLSPLSFQLLNNDSIPA